MMITINVMRPLLYRGERQEAGARLDVPAIDAADLLASGRAELLRQQDRPAIKDAIKAGTKAALRKTDQRDRVPGWILRSTGVS